MHRGMARPRHSTVPAARRVAPGPGPKRQHRAGRPSQLSRCGPAPCRATRRCTGKGAACRLPGFAAVRADQGGCRHHPACPICVDIIQPVQVAARRRQVPGRAGRSVWQQSAGACDKAGVCVWDDCGWPVGRKSGLSKLGVSKLGVAKASAWRCQVRSVWQLSAGVCDKAGVCV